MTITFHGGAQTALARIYPTLPGSSCLLQGHRRNALLQSLRHCVICAHQESGSSDEARQTAACRSFVYRRRTRSGEALFIEQVLSS